MMDLDDLDMRVKPLIESLPHVLHCNIPDGPRLTLALEVVVTATNRPGLVDLRYTYGTVWDGERYTLRGEGELLAVPLGNSGSLYLLGKVLNHMMPFEPLNAYSTKEVS